MALLVSLVAIVSPVATAPALATEGSLRCWVVADESGFEIGWFGEVTASVERFAVSRRSFGVFRPRATVDAPANGFRDSPTHRSISAEYRVAALTEAGDALVSASCNSSNTPGLTCTVHATLHGYQVSWQGGAWEAAGSATARDVVVRRSVTDGGRLWWRGRVADAISFNDESSPTGFAHYVIEMRRDERITAMAVCGQAAARATASGAALGSGTALGSGAALGSDTALGSGDALTSVNTGCPALSVSQETERSTDLTVGPDGRVYHLGRVGDASVLQVLDRNGGPWRTLAETADYARSFVTAGDRLYFVENDEADGRLRQIHLASGTVSTAVTMASIDRVLHVTGDGTLYLRANNGTTGDDLWRFDPARGTASLVIDLNGTNQSQPDSVVESSDGSIYFTAFNGSPERGLFRYQPRSTAFEAVALDGLEASELQPYGDLSGALYFAKKGVGVIRLDPTTGQRRQVFELHDEALDANLVAAGPDGRLYFGIANTGEPGHGRLMIYDARSGETTHPPFASAGVVQRIDFATADRFVVTSQVPGGDRIEAVDLNTGISSLAPADGLPPFVWHVASSANGHTYFSGTKNIYSFSSSLGCIATEQQSEPSPIARWAG